ncbi:MULTISPECIES: ArdC-like ssDNA-binding domain-containing protein [Nocardia]|uniref:ArdC-like ssDNA-binding domain-containing protein n=1 Tax=Nocardia TaxID=1817 RepID=UPI0024585FF0|nr:MULTISPECIES: ArdC-like ssDNA-binding domain-containing protein [Nocardia]
MATATKAKKSTRKTYSQADRDARRAADEAIREEAAELLGDPEQVAQMIAQLARLTSPKLLRYSLRNVALIFKQAADRGVTVTDVDTFKGWRQRGRGVRKGERGLRIVAPKGRQAAEGADGEAAEAPAEVIEVDTTSGEGESAPARARFRMVTVFDVSQTEGIEDFEGEPAEPAPVTEPASAIRARLIEQFDAIGYTVTEGIEPGTDDDAHTVTVPEGQPLPQLAQALAALLTRPAD